tara:strand:- start:700 stop:855 length:156 start_codon:yes stop_codon:yes gene_type:complete
VLVGGVGGGVGGGSGVELPPPPPHDAKTITLITRQKPLKKLRIYITYHNGK